MKDQIFFNALIENSIDGIITVNEQGIVESINPSACNLFLYYPHEIIGKSIEMLIPRCNISFKSAAIGKFKGVDRDVLGKKKDGRVFPFRLGLSEIKFKKRRIFTGFIHDLSCRDAAENKLLQYTQHLEEIVKDRTVSLNETINALTQAKEEISIALDKERKTSHLKSRLLSMASHEFRTPLSTIQLSSSLIQHYAVDAHNNNIENHVHKIKSAICNLTTILDDFLQLEKTESDKVTVSASCFELDFFVEEIIDELQLLAKKKQNIINTHEGTATLVKLDKNLLKNCIINLVSNAIKYSGEETDIEINTSIDTNNINIIVKDNGMGIPTEEQDHLFEAFFRAHNTTNIPGTGLGLHIVSRYVKLMGGTIMCQSKLNEGTIFTIKFPLT